MMAAAQIADDSPNRNRSWAPPPVCWRRVRPKPQGRFVWGRRRRPCGRGALPTPLLGDILDSASFTPQDLDGAAALARSEPLMNGLARIRAALKIAGTDEARAELVHAGVRNRRARRPTCPGRGALCGPCSRDHAGAGLGAQVRSDGARAASRQPGGCGASAGSTF